MTLVIELEQRFESVTQQCEICKHLQANGSENNRKATSIQCSKRSFADRCTVNGRQGREYTCYLVVGVLLSTHGPVVDDEDISGQVKFCDHPVRVVGNHNFVPRRVEGEQDPFDSVELALLGHHSQRESEVVTFTLICLQNGLGIQGVQNADLSKIGIPIDKKLLSTIDKNAN